MLTRDIPTSSGLFRVKPLLQSCGHKKRCVGTLVSSCRSSQRTSLRTQLGACIQVRNFGKHNVYRKLQGSLESAYGGKGRRSEKGRKGQKGRAPAWLGQQAELRGPRVAIVGRTNVGKSTLFNRLVGSQLAMTDDMAGVTRDRQEAQASLVDLDFVLVDTPGVEELGADVLVQRRIRLDSKAQLLRGMREQSEAAIDGSDVVLYMYDAKVGLTPEDLYLANWLQRKVQAFNSRTPAVDEECGKDASAVVQTKHIVAVANKAEVYADCTTIIAEAHELGFGEPVCLSSTSGIGMVDLFHALDEVFVKIDIWRDTELRGALPVSSASSERGVDGALIETSDGGKEKDAFSDPHLDELEALTEKYKDETNESLKYETMQSLEQKVFEDQRGGRALDGTVDGIGTNNEFADDSISSVFKQMRNEFDFEYDPSPIGKKQLRALERARRKSLRGFGGNMEDATSDERLSLRFEEGYIPRMPRPKLVEVNRNEDTGEVVLADEFGEMTAEQKREYDLIAAIELDNDPRVLSEARLMAALGEDPTVLYAHADDASEITEDKEKENDAESDSANAKSETVQVKGGDSDLVSSKDFSLKLCIIGRPNVGKSSLVNALLGESRCLVADAPGITRDSVAIELQHNGTRIKLVDTAGIIGLTKGAYERRSEATRLNILAMKECLRSVRYSNVVCIVVDINEKVLGTVDAVELSQKLIYYNKGRGEDGDSGVSQQSAGGVGADGGDDYRESAELDTTAMDRLHNDSVNAAKRIVCALLSQTDRQMIDFVITQGRGCVLVINKWDQMQQRHREVLRLLKHCLPLVFKETGGLPLVITSAKYKKGIGNMLSTAVDVYSRWNSRIPTPVLNRFVYEMQRIYPPPRLLRIKRMGRWKKYIKPKIRYMTQYTIRPPSFVGFCGSQLVSDYYFYRMRRLLRQEFGLVGVPLRIKLRSALDTTVPAHMHHSAKLWSAGGIRQKNTLHAKGQIRLSGRGRSGRLLKEDWIEMRLQTQRKKQQLREQMTEAESMRLAAEKKLTVDRFATHKTDVNTLIPV